MIPFTLADGGRDTKERGDCSVRALALACGLEYSEAHARLAAIGRKPRCGLKFKLWSANLSSLGLEMRADLSCKTLATAMPDMTAGRFIVSFNNHFMAVVNGVALDMLQPKPKRRVRMVYEVIEGGIA